MIHAIGASTPDIHPEAFVHPDATLIGAVIISAGASIWPAAVLRGDMGSITVGEASSIQDGAVVHMTEGLSHTVVGSKVTVGHRAMLHGCIVEDECLVGMGAILLDNVRVGHGSLIGAGALVTAHTVIPPGSLVLGAPARIVRSVDERERLMIEVGWRSYLELAARYRAALAP